MVAADMVAVAGMVVAVAGMVVVTAVMVAFTSAYTLASMAVSGMSDTSELVTSASTVSALVADVGGTVGGGLPVLAAVGASHQMVRFGFAVTTTERNL